MNEQACSLTDLSRSCTCWSETRSPAGPVRSLFADGAAPRKLSLAACESYDHGVVYMNYRADLTIHARAATARPAPR